MRKGDFIFFTSFIINQHVRQFLFLTRDLTNYYVCQNALRLSKCITSVKMHYVCRNALRLSKCITSVEMHYVCQNALRLSKCITSVKMHYGYINSDLALLPYISAFYKSNSRRSILLPL